MHPVSREIEDFIKLLLKWNKRHNLISSQTENDIYVRHVQDSLQLRSYIRDDEVVLDIGSGAGFPGAMLSFSGVKKVILIERNAKKAAFLREVALMSPNDIEVLNSDVRELSFDKVDVVTSRACSSLKNLLDFMYPFCKNTTKGVFLKGEKLPMELEEALKSWEFEYSTSKSITSQTGSIIIITRLKKRYE